MSTRLRSARILLLFATAWLGIWAGAQIFNALMVVPYFSANPPQSLAAWGQLRYSNLADFFVIFNALWAVLAFGMALAIGGPALGRSRPWIAASAIAALAAAVAVIAWMAPTIGSVVRPNMSGVPLDQALRQLHMWTTANWIRITIETAGFVCALVALARVPAESAAGMEVSRA